MKNDVFPPIASTFSKTSSLGIKVRCLEAFTVLCGGTVDEPTLEDDLSGTAQSSRSKSIKSSILDKYTIQEKLIPSLKVIKTKEPAVMLAALKVFRQVGDTVDTDFLALEVLPILWSFSLGPLLNLQQFGEFMSLIKSLSGKVEREQTKKLQELSSGDAGGFQNGTGSHFNVAADTGPSNIDNARDNFERLVLGKGSAASSSQETDLWGGLGTDPPAARTSSQGTLPQFSWSSNAAAAANSPPSTQPTPGFRTVTPDHNLGSFPSLQPAQQKSSTAPAFPPLQPASAGSAHKLQGSMSGSSLSNLATMGTSNTSFQGQAPQQSPNYSSFSIPPPPSTSRPLGSYTAPTAGPNANRQSLRMNMASSSMQSNPPQPQTQAQRQGLEQYESLL